MENSFVIAVITAIITGLVTLLTQRMKSSVERSVGQTNAAADVVSSSADVINALTQSVETCYERIDKLQKEVAELIEKSRADNEKLKECLDARRQQTASSSSEGGIPERGHSSGDSKTPERAQGDAS